MQSLRARDKRRSASLVSRFQSVHLTRGLNATLADEPDTTLDELARLVERHPQLHDVTLAQLLVELRRKLQARADAIALYGSDPDVAALAPLIEAIVSKNRKVAQKWRHELEPRTLAELAMPKLEISTEAARRIDGHEWLVAHYIVKGLRAALRLGVSEVRIIIIVPVDLDVPGHSDDGVEVSFRVGLTGDRDSLRTYLSDLAEGLPLEIWAGL